MLGRGGHDLPARALASDLQKEHPGSEVEIVVKSAAPEVLAGVRARAMASDGVLVVDMAGSAHRTRRYGAYLAGLAGTPAAQRLFA